MQVGVVVDLNKKHGLEFMMSELEYCDIGDQGQDHFYAVLFK